MRPSKGKSNSKRESEGLQPVPKPIERFEKTNGSKVLLLVGHDDLPSGFHQFLVSESCLYNLGPRWKDLLSNRSTNKPMRLFSKSPMTVNLRDEHANAIRIFMHIAHLQFTKLPNTLDFPEIVHLADVAARYDAHSLLVNNIDTWLAPYRDRLLKPGFEEWLFVAHQFGYETEYLELAKHLSLHCRVDPTGTWLLAPGTDYILEGKFPIDTLEHIKEGRIQILYNMLQTTYELWASISQGSNCKIANEDEPNVQKGCAAINLFEFTNYLRGIELFPMIKETTNFQPSAHELATMLSNAQQMIPIASTLFIGRRGSAPVESPRHGQCHIGHQLAAIMVQILERVRWPVEIPTLLCIKANGGEYQTDYAYAHADADVDEKLDNQSQRVDETSDFLNRESLLERRFRCVKSIEAALETDPNALNAR